eukprot:1118613-Prorocentrum_minimum.AAC.1
MALGEAEEVHHGAGADGLLTNVIGVSVDVIGTVVDVIGIRVDVVGTGVDVLTVIWLLGRPRRYTMVRDWTVSLRM